MRPLFVSIISIYQRFFSPDTGVFSTRSFVCPFYPSCSEYTKQAIEQHGALKGARIGIQRVIRCGRSQTPQINHVPSKDCK